MSVKMRMAVEREIVEKVIDTLLAAGYTLGVNDGEGEVLAPTTGSRELVLAHLFTTDSDFLLTKAPGGRRGWVMFVYGNSGWDVISDYTVSLDDLLEPILEWADETYGD